MLRRESRNMVAVMLSVHCPIASAKFWIPELKGSSAPERQASKEKRNACSVARKSRNNVAAMFRLQNSGTLKGCCIEDP